MKSLLVLLLLFALTPLSAQFDWLELASGSVLTEDYLFRGVDITPSGQVYSVGSYQDLVGTSTIRQRPVLVKYTPSGSLDYTRVFGNNSGNETAYDVAYDAANNQVLIAGTLNGRPHLERIDPGTGSSISTIPFNGSGLIKAIDVTATHIYAIGNYSGTLTIGALPPLSGGSAFVAQFDFLGNPVDAINIVANQANGFDIKADATGNVYFTATTEADIIFSPGALGNYTYSGSGTDQVLVRANNLLQAEWSTTLRSSASRLTENSELPVALNEGIQTVYAAIPFEPTAIPVLDGEILAFQMLTGASTGVVTTPGRTVRDLAVACDTLWATGGTQASFVRALCNNNGHAAWFEAYSSSLSGFGANASTTCAYSEAIALNEFGGLTVAGWFQEAPVLTWDTEVESGNQRKGALTAKYQTGSTCCTSSVERCLDFSGTGDVLTFATSPLSGQPAFTLETWFKFEGPSSNAFRTIFFNNGPTVLTLGVRNNGLFVRAGGPPTFQVAPVTTGTWHRLTVTYQSGSMTTYLDGTPVDQQAVTLNLNNEFNIGQQTLTSGNAFSWDGQLDDIAVYAYAKGPGEILAGLDCAPTGSEAGITLYLPLDQGLPGQGNPSIISATDLSSSGNNGNLQNFALNGQTSNWVCSDLILPVCPPDTCSASLPVNTFSRYREHLDVGSAPTDKELDLAYGAFRLPQGNIIQVGVVAGSDAHNPIYVAKTEPDGTPIGNPDLYHPTTGNEAITLLQNTPTPIRNAFGNLTGFLATGITELPGANQQRVLLRFDTSLALLDSRFYQPIIPGVRERFTDIIQDSNGDYIAIGNIDQSQFNAGFAMRILPDLSIQHYHKLEDATQDIYLDKVIEGSFNTGGVGGGTTSAYLVAGRSLSGEIFLQGLPFDLSTLGSFTINLGVAGTGNGSQYVAGLEQLSDGRLAVTGNAKSGEIWLNLLTGSATGVTTNSYLIDVDNGTEEAYATALRPGDRLLIGGRAESGNSSNDGARALLLEVDLNTTTINWVRTYGNSNYPESLITDIHADDKGILLSGYGITLTGTTAGGFFGDLDHWDSWLAATDTLGKVFDCDCYATTYGRVLSPTVAINGVFPNISAVIQGQDDLAQDRTKAPIVDYFCDQYVAPPLPPVCPGGSEVERTALTDGTTLTVDGGTWTLANDELPASFEVTVTWGDGRGTTVPGDQLPLTHVYRDTGRYDVCLTYHVFDTAGDLCWERTTCKPVITSTRARNVPAVRVKAYPNPTNGMVYLSYPLLHGYPEVTVFTVDGRPVHKVNQLRNQQLSLTGLPGGVYILRMRFPNGAMARKRVILR